MDRANYEPIARVAAVDCVLVAGDRADGAAALEALLASPPPEIPEEMRRVWGLRMDSLVRGAAADPLVPADTAGRIRSWGRVP